MVWKTLYFKNLFLKMKSREITYLSQGLKVNRAKNLDGGNIGLPQSPVE